MKRLILLAIPFTLMTSGCSQWIEDFTPASSISKKGFAYRIVKARTTKSYQVKIWGYVDYVNISTQPDIGKLTPNTWSFNLKAKATDAVGESFQIIAPKDASYQELIRHFKANAAAGIQTVVLIEGKLSTFDAPTNFARLTGLYVEVESSKNIQIHSLE